MICYALNKRNSKEREFDKLVTEKTKYKYKCDALENELNTTKIALKGCKELLEKTLQEHKKTIGELEAYKGLYGAVKVGYIELAKEYAKRCSNE